MAEGRAIRIGKISDQLIDALNRTDATLDEAVKALLDAIRSVVAQTECPGCRKLLVDILPEGLSIALADAEAFGVARDGRGSAHIH